MITFIITLLLSWGIAAALDGERDTIVYKPLKAWSSSKWWLEQNYLVRVLKTKPQNQLWVKVALVLLQYPFSFAINGWHFCKSSSLVFLTLPFAIINPYFDWYLFVIAFYIYYGIIFNISYDY